MSTEINLILVKADEDLTDMAHIFETCPTLSFWCGSSGMGGAVMEHCLYDEATEVTEPLLDEIRGELDYNLDKTEHRLDLLKQSLPGNANYDEIIELMEELNENADSLKIALDSLVFIKTMMNDLQFNQTKFKLIFYVG